MSISLQALITAYLTLGRPLAAPYFYRRLVRRIEGDRAIVTIVILAVAAVWLALSARGTPHRSPEGAHLLPATSTERWHFAALAVTSGVCEEILYRGLLMTALSAMLPLEAAFVLTTLLFGAAHGTYGWFGKSYCAIAFRYHRSRTPLLLTSVRIED